MSRDYSESRLRNMRMTWKQKQLKGKKNEILDLLNNFNKLLSEEEFKEIERNLHEAFRQGDLD